MNPSRSVVLAVVCSSFLWSSSWGQSNALEKLNDMQITSDNGTHLTVFWTEPDDAPSFSYFYIDYSQVRFDHSSGSLYVSPIHPSLQKVGTHYTYPFPKDRLLVSKLYDSLLFRVRGYISPVEWYSKEVAVDPQIAQSSASFALEVSLLGLNCDFVHHRIGATNIISELEYVIHSQVPTYLEELGGIEGSHVCEDQVLRFRGTIFTAGNSSSLCINAIREWLASGQSLIVISGRHYYVSQSSCGLELSSPDAPDCSATTSAITNTCPTTAGTAVGFGETNIALILGCIALGLLLVVVSILFTSLICVCIGKKRKEQKELASLMVNLKDTNSYQAAEKTSPQRNQEEIYADVYM